MRSPDWEQIENAYRAGVLSLREIAGQRGISEGAIRKRAKRDGWTRDLAAKIKSKADDLVRTRAVRSEVRTEGSIPDRVLIEANAEVIANIRLEHRSDISRSRNLVIKLLNELESQTDNKELFDQLGELMRKPDDKGVDKLNDLYHKVISLQGRTTTMKGLSDSLKTLVTLERQAYGLDEDKGNNAISDLADLMKELSDEA